MHTAIAMADQQPPQQGGDKQLVTRETVHSRISSCVQSTERASLEPRSIASEPRQKTSAANRDGISLQRLHVTRVMDLCTHGFLSVCNRHVTERSTSAQRSTASEPQQQTSAANQNARRPMNSGTHMHHCTLHVCLQQPNVQQPYPQSKQAMFSHLLCHSRASQTRW